MSKRTYHVTIKKEGNWYYGYIDGEYVMGSSSLTRWGCKRAVKEELNKKTIVVEEYDVTLGGE